MSTIKNTDKILDLDKGRLVEIGTYKELIMSEGHFSRLHKIQEEASHLTENLFSTAESTLERVGKE